MSIETHNSFMAADSALRAAGYRQTGGDPIAEEYDYDADGNGAVLRRTIDGWEIEHADVP